MEMGSGTWSGINIIFKTEKINEGLISNYHKKL